MQSLTGPPFVFSPARERKGATKFWLYFCPVLIRFGLSDGGNERVYVLESHFRSDMVSFMNFTLWRKRHEI